MTIIKTLVLAATLAAVSTSALAADIDWPSIDQAMGRKGADQPGGVHKYSFPRSDLKITVDGVAIKPALALGGWVAFEPMGGSAMFMGDLVLTDTEISPVMERLLAGGIEVTAIHNHLLRTSSPVFYMHIGGHGDPAKVAATIHAALTLSQTPSPSAPPSAPQAPLTINTEDLDATLGFKGTVNGGVYQFSIPRAEAITEGGMPAPPSMGTAMAINFQPADVDGTAVATGDFILLGSEVQPVLKALRSHGIEVTALHSHMVDDSPHMFFMHFWAHDNARKIAQGLRSALDLTNIKRGA